MLEKDEFAERVQVLRPQLHRYCARMIGSFIDADDVIQTALTKAYRLLPETEIRNLEGWLMRIVHNSAVDYLRTARLPAGDEIDELPAEDVTEQPLEDEAMATLAFSVFLQLTPIQRSCVILKDVMGYSLAEISEYLGISVGAVKAALNRGRQNLQQMANTVELDKPLPLSETEARLLKDYVAQFSARNFDGLRALLASEVKLNLVGRLQTQGASEVGKYFQNYSKVDDWVPKPGLVEGRPAVLVGEPGNPDNLIYFILIQWEAGKISRITDYRYARYAVEDLPVYVDIL